jgi:toxin-antitoxin system PIN domain toxin
MHLLDANALIALGWPTHEHHETMQAWFDRHARRGWATTALTQAAFVRVVSQPAFSGRSIGVAEVAELLLRNVAHARHRLVPLDFGFEQVLGRCSGGVVGHRQITDAYLLTAAMRSEMKLLTFDAGVASLLASAPERQRHITLLESAP